MEAFFIGFVLGAVAAYGVYVIAKNKNFQL
jgi:hypothetical protein